MKFQHFQLAVFLSTTLCAACGADHTSSPAGNKPAPAAKTTAKPAPAAAQPALDVPYVPTHEMVLDEMLKMAQVKGGDVLYDLGSGDGRIPIAAAKRFGTRGVGIDLDPRRIAEANENARQAGVTDKVKFVAGDLFQFNFSQASVVTLYLLPEVNLKLRPQLLSQLKPGTRVVSHNYHMGDWKPARTKKVTTPDGVDHYVFFWRVPRRK